MAVQKLSWGKIEWMEDEETLAKEKGMKVGLVTLYSGAHQAQHLHFEEQVLYVVKGTAISYVGEKKGEQVVMKPGDYFHWPAGIFHETLNTGEEDFQHLLISNPNYENMDRTVYSIEQLGNETEKERCYEQKQQETSEFLLKPSDRIYMAVESIRSQFLENMHYSYVIFDTAGNMVLQSKRYPSYCEACCHPESNEGQCPCMLFSCLENKDIRQSFICPFGMEVYHYPLTFHNQVIGYIQGGYIRRTSNGFLTNESLNNGTGSENVPEVYEVPESVVAGIRVLLGQIVKAVQNYCEFEQFKEELLQREMKLISSEKSRQVLMRDFQDAQYAMTDLKINNHFLFNTLNGMASMALDAKAMPLYQSIVDLSKMFHYTLRTQSSMVPLQKEIEYVRAYLKLQKIRYGESLKLFFDVEDNLLNCTVPFNFLQPVVENAFTHGFQESDEKKIYISIKRNAEELSISVCNSGKKMTEEVCKTINRRMKAGVSHGLSMIYLKLQAIYGKNFSFFSSPWKKSGIRFTISFPINNFD
ncbi:MAG: histidine kinase [Lachnospiraceae bacterium]|nr:histidine kinase [Lachnospiraceae bacterium]